MRKFYKSENSCPKYVSQLFRVSHLNPIGIALTAFFYSEEKKHSKTQNHTPQCTCCRTKNSIKSHREKEGHGMATLHTK